MSKVIAGITTSVDGYVSGPDDGPGKGLGEGGERLHYWVFGGPWSYENEPRGEPSGPDAEWLNEVSSKVGAGKPSNSTRPRRTMIRRRDPATLQLTSRPHRDTGLPLRGSDEP